MDCQERSTPRQRLSKAVLYSFGYKDPSEANTEKNAVSVCFRGELFRPIARIA